MLRNPLLLAFALATAAPLAATNDALAQAKKQSAKAIDVAKIQKELESGDEARIVAALEEISKAGDAGKPAAPHVDKLLGRGTSAKVLVRALEVAAGLKQQSSSAAIAPYVRHRAAEVRRAATRALTQTGGPAAITALRKALRSSDPQVRALAATGLGEIRAKEAINDLFTALDHKLVEAASAIGQLCDPSDCDKFWGRLGKLPFEVVIKGLDKMLFRPAAEMADEQKIKIVKQLGELGTREALSFLTDVGSRWPDNWSKKVKQAIETAVRASGKAER
jgi:HEAT repeat protein